MSSKDSEDLVWLDEGFFIASVRAVIERDPKAKKCLEDRSEDPSDYKYLMYRTLKYMNNFMKQFGEANKVLTRKKDNAESQKLRDKGNKVFVTQKDLQGLEESLELYTKSIAYAIPNTQEMAKGFANRSAVLLRLERPKECLEDIERALYSNYPKELIPKLIIRQGECFAMLARHSYIHAKFWLKQVPENDPDRKVLKKDLKDYSIKGYKSTIDPEDPAFPIIQSPHAEFPCASDAIDLKYFGQNEKKIVATRDIRVGEVLVVEKPYLSQLFESSLYAYCYECQQSFFSGIPCDSCPNVVFCSEKCKLTAWKLYHNVECPVLNSLKQSEPDEIIDGDTHADALLVHKAVSLKLAIKCSYEAGGLKALQERIDEFHRCNDGKLKSEWYEKQTLESILALNSNIKKITNEDFEMQTAEALYILFHLATTTNFLGNQYDRNRMSDGDIVLSMAHNKNAQFVGGLLLKLLLIVTYNNCMSKELLRSVNLPNTPGIVMPLFLPMTQRKCYFNSKLQFIGEHAILRSIAPIKTEEEVLRPHFLWMCVPKEERLSDDEWLTECSCRACVENWPTEDYLESFEDRSKSSKSIAKLKKVLQPLQSITDALWDGKIKDYEKTLNVLESMMEAIYREVRLPCREQVEIFKLFLRMYKDQTSKRSWRQDVSWKDIAQANKMPEKYISALQIS